MILLHQVLKAFDHPRMTEIEIEVRPLWCGAGRGSVEGLLSTVHCPDRSVVCKVFPFRIVICVGSLDVEYCPLSLVYDMIDPGAAAIVLLASDHPKSKAVCDLSRSVDEVVQFGPWP